MKILLLFGMILLISCSLQYNIVQSVVVLNAHDYKYGYVINYKAYKGNLPYKIGDTLPRELPKELLIIK